MIRLGVLASGNGTNLQALLEAVTEGILKNVAEIVVVISNKAKAYALERAKLYNISAHFIPKASLQTAEDYDSQIIEQLHHDKVDVVILAGYLRILTPRFLHAYPDRILNIHPSLLPAFGGSGMYGTHVHQAVLDAGVKYSGCTVHVVTEKIDEGPILDQSVVKVNDSDTVDSLAEKILMEEHVLYPRAIKRYIEDRLCIKELL